MRSLAFLGFSSYYVTSLGEVYSRTSGKFLSKHYNYGYLRVAMYSDDGVKKTYRIHRLVAMAYFPRHMWKEVVNHKNGKRDDNSLGNVEWMTQSENVIHAYETGLIKNKRRDSQRSISDELAHEICQMIEDNLVNKEIIFATGVSPGVVSGIRNGTVYTDIVSTYDFSNCLSSRRKISDEKIRQVCEGIENGLSWRDLKSLGVSSATIAKIKSRKTGTHISQHFSW